MPSREGGGGRKIFKTFSLLSVFRPSEVPENNNLEIYQVIMVLLYIYRGRELRFALTFVSPSFRVCVSLLSQTYTHCWGLLPLLQGLGRSQTTTPSRLKPISPAKTSPIHSCIHIPVSFTGKEVAGFFSISFSFLFLIFILFYFFALEVNPLL